jgi:hypothetical protein
MPIGLSQYLQVFSKTGAKFAKFAKLRQIRQIAPNSRKLAPNSLARKTSAQKNPSSYRPWQPAQFKKVDLLG